MEHTEKENQRRQFIKTSAALGILSLTGLSSLSGCKDKDDEGQEISPPEDLMQEHGLLNRILLIYDFNRIQLLSKQTIQLEELKKAAAIIRNFVEDYHEKQEEEYIFPRFEKVHQLNDLVTILKDQHKKGRIITDKIIQLCKTKNLVESENEQLIDLLSGYTAMYRPHEAREDTVLFPAFRKIVSKHEYDSLGEEFEKNEHNLFGKEGFEMTMRKIASIEEKLGIYNLAQFTPKI
jgi:hemerythrin-like domain-containing protein